MKQLYALLAFLILGFSVEAQTVQSSCSASDSIKNQYIEDAKRLALRKIFRQNLAYKDSVEIPQIHSDTVLNALVAVYNATNLPARDTVVTLSRVGSNQVGIHTFIGNPVTNYYELFVDATYNWVSDLIGGQIPTSDSTFNQLLSRYESYIYGAPLLWGGNLYSIILKTDSSKNLAPLITKFQSIPGVHSANIGGFAGDGPDIYDTIQTDHVALTYEYAWETCPSGCGKRRFWKFKVYFDCRVEYTGSYGDALQVTSLNDQVSAKISAYPNPFQNSITIENISEPFHYSITNTLGQLINEGQAENSRIENLDKLPPGLYFLNIKGNKYAQTFRIFKE